MRWIVQERIKNTVRSPPQKKTTSFGCPRLLSGVGAGGDFFKFFFYKVIFVLFFL